MNGNALQTGALVVTLAIIVLCSSCFLGSSDGDYRNQDDGNGSDRSPMVLGAPAGSGTDPGYEVNQNGDGSGTNPPVEYVRYDYVDGSVVGTTEETTYYTKIPSSIDIYYDNEGVLGSGTYVVDYWFQYTGFGPLTIEGSVTIILLGDPDGGDGGNFNTHGLTINGDLTVYRSPDHDGMVDIRGDITGTDGSSFTNHGGRFTQYEGGTSGLEFNSYNAETRFRKNETLLDCNPINLYGGTLTLDCTETGNTPFGDNVVLNSYAQNKTTITIDNGGNGISGGKFNFTDSTVEIEVSGGCTGITGGEFNFTNSDVEVSTWFRNGTDEADYDSVGIAGGKFTVNGGSMTISSVSGSCVNGGNFDIDGELIVTTDGTGTCITGGEFDVDGKMTMNIDGDGSRGIAGGTVVVDGPTELNPRNDGVCITGGTVDLTGDVTTPKDIGDGKAIALESGEVNYRGGGTFDVPYVDIVPTNGGTADFNIYGGTAHMFVVKSEGDDAMFNVHGGEITIYQLFSNAEIDNGYVYVSMQVSSDDLTVSGGGALFYNDMYDTTDNSDYTNEMNKYDLSEVYDHLELYAKAYRNGQGYSYVIDHIHNQNGPWHEGGHHQHCGVPRYDKPFCDYSPDVSFHSIIIVWKDDYTHEAVCSNPDCPYSYVTEHSHDGTYRPVEDDEYGHYYDCPECGGEGYEEHELQGYLTDDLRHYIVCSECGWWRVSDHEIEFDYSDEEEHHWYCPDCEDGGYVEHDYTWVDNGDGTHTGTCYCKKEDGSLHQVIEEHTYVNGVCDKCGAIHPGLIGGGMDDYYPPAWGYDEIQDVHSKEKEEWIAIAVAATAATIMAVFLIWDRKRAS